VESTLLGTPAGVDSDNDAGARNGACRPSDGNGRHENVGSSIASRDARQAWEGVGQLETIVTPQELNIEEGTVFAAYRVQKAIVRSAHAHPANVVESTAMASVEPPDVTYRHHLPAEIIAEGHISDLQIEDVIYAGQATSALLPDASTRKGDAFAPPAFPLSTLHATRFVLQQLRTCSTRVCRLRMCNILPVTPIREPRGCTTGGKSK